MKAKIKYLALVLVLSLLLPLAGCGKLSGRYRILETLESQSFSIGFRDGDYVQYYVEAALKVLAADGTVQRTAMKWFGEDKTSFSKDIDALEKVGTAAYRTLLVGVDTDVFPMSYMENGNYTGFDVELAREVCTRLGWDVMFIPIKAENAYVELSSGNIDVAWGGLVLDNSEGKFETLPPYLSNDIALVTLADGGAKTLRGLNGQSLGITTESKFIEALSADEKLMNRFDQIKRLTGGSKALLDALTSRQVDAIIVYSISLAYYG